ncbi:unnamed protein product [Thlaspi arvense]|uniref:Uncharacterized protein n=1 Tax=Thlaspi arvense TaxID=13288 RepID=A0AAU9S5T2_THLAR|nr:unnamed protein product [Thlaspi arvense]
MAVYEITWICWVKLREQGIFFFPVFLKFSDQLLQNLVDLQTSSPLEIIYSFSAVTPWHFSLNVVELIIYSFSAITPSIVVELLAVIINTNTRGDFLGALEIIHSLCGICHLWIVPKVLTLEGESD